ncbi:MAG TPA: chromate transporter [Acetobacteraceae bacterium]|nr:chromate transporter [Acetobacteraceae bacterium]
MPPPPRPSLGSLFSAFAAIGMMSFGGGLAAWIRREVVQRRQWLDDQQFLSGYALSQLVPGASNVNLTVFIGAQLRGVPGAIAAVVGLTALPVAIVFGLGMLYLRRSGLPAGGAVEAVLAGMGAAAIGLNLGTGIRLGRLHLRRLIPAAIAIIIALAVGVLGFSLLHVLAVMLPVSLALAWLEQRA